MTAEGWSRIPVVCPRCRGPLDLGRDDAECAACSSRYPVSEGILHLTAGREGAPGYDPHFFSTLQGVEGRHFWFVGRRAVVLDSLRRSVPDLEDRGLFDIGCGTGGLLEHLALNGVNVVGACDAYLESLEIVGRRVKLPLLLVDEGRLPPLAPGHQALALFDVLEHLDDDRGMLGFLHSVLEPGGVLVITVPAHPFLFDERDEMAHHRRRYRRGELREKLEAAGFEVRVLTHFMAALAPPLLVMRAIGALVPRPAESRRQRQIREFQVVPVVNGLLRAVLAVERRLLRFTSLPFGSSLIAVAVRPPESAGTGAMIDVNERS